MGWNWNPIINFIVEYLQKNSVCCKISSITNKCSTNHNFCTITNSNNRTTLVKIGATYLKCTVSRNRSTSSKICKSHKNVVVNIIVVIRIELNTIMFCNSISTCFKNYILITIYCNTIDLTILRHAVHRCLTYCKTTITTCKNYWSTESLKRCDTYFVGCVMEHICSESRKHLIKLPTIVYNSTLKTESSRCLLVNSPRTRIFLNIITRYSYKVYRITSPTNPISKNRIAHRTSL